MKNILMYSYELAGYEYRADHPFKPVRAKIFMELLHRYGLIGNTNQMVVEPVPIEERLLSLFHKQRYIELLKRVDRMEFDTEMLSAGIGTEDNPIFRSMFRFFLMTAGATHQAAMMLLEDKARVAFNPVGGFHHAGEDHAEGFCYINDIAIAIKDMVEKGQRVAYIDIDVHHGNGVQNAFYDTDRVLTISVHESGMTIYPGTGFEPELGIGDGLGYNVNIPLLAGSDDEVYLYVFDSIVIPVLERFSPDMVFAAIGCDAHKDDPLGHMNLTSYGYKGIIERINRVSPKIIALGAGGYNIYRTAALWALAWAIFCGLEPEDRFAGIIGGQMYGPEQKVGALDDPPFVLTGEEKALCMREAIRLKGFMERNLFPIHRIT